MATAWDKNEARSRLRRVRSSAYVPAVPGVVSALLAHERVASSVIVASYISYGDEVPTAALHAALGTQRVVVPAPGPRGCDLTWTWLDSVAPQPAHVAARRGQAGTALRGSELASIGVVIVPGIAFATDGGRLGQGGGWYDRALSALPQAWKIGLSWDATLVEHLPTQAHDVAMDAVCIPERGIILTDR